MEVLHKTPSTSLLGFCFSKVQAFAFTDYSFTFMITSHTEVTAHNQVKKSTRDQTCHATSSPTALQGWGPLGIFTPYKPRLVVPWSTVWMIMYLRRDKGLMKEKRPNGPWRGGEERENYKEKMVDRVKGRGALFHFTETINMEVHAEFSHSLSGQKCMQPS